MPDWAGVTDQALEYAVDPVASATLPRREYGGDVRYLKAAKDSALAAAKAVRDERTREVRVALQGRFYRVSTRPNDIVSMWLTTRLGTQVRTSDNKTLEVSRDDIDSMFAQISAEHAAAYDEYWRRKDAILACTSAAEVDALR